MFVIYSIIKFQHQHCNENIVAECHFYCQFGRNVRAFAWFFGFIRHETWNEVQNGLVNDIFMNTISPPALQRKCSCWLSHCQYGQDNNAHIILYIFRFIHHNKLQSFLSIIHETVCHFCYSMFEWRGRVEYLRLESLQVRSDDPKRTVLQANNEGHGVERAIQMDTAGFSAIAGVTE